MRFTPSFYPARALPADAVSPRCLFLARPTSRKRGRYLSDFGAAHRAHRKDCSAYFKRGIA
eukprot:IDg23464t1